LGTLDDPDLLSENVTRGIEDGIWGKDDLEIMEKLGLRGVRNPKDYASYDDYIKAVEADLDNLFIPREGFEGGLEYDLDTGEYAYDFHEEGGMRPPGYDYDDPFFEEYAEFPTGGNTPDIPDNEIPENWWWPTEGMTDDEYLRELERIRDLSFGGKKRFKPLDPLDDLPF
jgi:hypothetical protein